MTAAIQIPNFASVEEVSNAIVTMLETRNYRRYIPDFWAPVRRSAGDAPVLA